MRENQNKNTKLVLKIEKQLQITRHHEEELQTELKNEQIKREQATSEVERGMRELQKEKEKYSRCVQNTVKKYEEEKVKRQKCQQQLISTKKELDCRSLEIKELQSEITTLTQKQGKNEAELLDRTNQELEASKSIISALKDDVKQKEINLETMKTLVKEIQKKNKKLRDGQIANEQWEKKNKGAHKSTEKENRGSTTETNNIGTGEREDKQQVH